MLFAHRPPRAWLGQSRLITGKIGEWPMGFAHAATTAHAWNCDPGLIATQRDSDYFCWWQRARAVRSVAVLHGGGVGG